MRTADTHQTQPFPVKNDYGFVGVQYLAEKFSRSSEEILNLFIDCDYSIRRTIEVLERSGLAA